MLCHLTVEVEDANTHKMVSTEQLDGSVLASANALAKSLDPKAKPFPTSNEEAIAAWGRGDFEKAVTLDPSFGPAWLSWIETAGAQRRHRRCDRNRRARAGSSVNSEIDALRIELVRANLEGDAHAEHEALLKLTARVADPTLLGEFRRTRIPRPRICAGRRRLQKDPRRAAGESGGTQ